MEIEKVCFPCGNEYGKTQLIGVTAQQDNFCDIC